MSTPKWVFPFLFWGELVKNNLLRYSGISLALAGVLTFVINAGLTPLMLLGQPGIETASSDIFLWRQSLSALAAIFLFLGIVGIYERQAEEAGLFGIFSFLLAFIGCAMLLAQEWNQIFFVRDLAMRAPETMQMLEDSEGLHLPDIGSIIALSFLVLGWTLFSISLIRAKVYQKTGPILIIVGLFATPILAAILPAVWGMFIGNAILAGGWFMLGLERFCCSIARRATGIV